MPELCLRLAEAESAIRNALAAIERGPHRQRNSGSMHRRHRKPLRSFELPGCKGTKPACKQMTAWFGPFCHDNPENRDFQEHPIDTLVLEGVLVLAYFAVAMLITLAVQKCCLPKTDSE